MTESVNGDATEGVKSLRFHTKGDVRLEQVPPLPCGPDEVRLSVAYCGICGTDVLEYLQGPVFPPKEGTSHRFTGSTLPITMGHEFSGTIIEAGAGVSSLSVGQRVAVNPALDHRHYGAKLCGSCCAGRYNTCTDTATYGLSAPGGGFCTEVVVKAFNCFVLPDGLSLKAAALSEPLAVAHHCIAASGFKKGQSVLVCGAGPIGLAIVLILRVLGAAKIVVTELAERRIAQATKFGADTVINPLQDERDGGKSALDAVLELSDGGVDVAFDAIGLQSTLDLVLAATRPGGTVFNVAIHKKPLVMNLNDITSRERRLLGGICYTHSDFEAVIDMMSSGKIDAEQMITSVQPLSNIVDGGFLELINNRDEHVKILIQPD